MIVWGGVDDGDRLNTGGRYNPSTDSWTATSTTNAPSARTYHTAVWTGSEMIVWGGYNWQRVEHRREVLWAISNTYAHTNTYAHSATADHHPAERRRSLVDGERP